jgi:site-specific DNA recombinase
MAEEMSDAGRTGRNANREGFRSLMATLKQLKPDAVLTTRLSRFMRNARLTLNAVHEMREIGVALICTDEPIDTRQRGVSDMLLAILATTAEWESDRLSEYAKETRRRLIGKNRLPSGRPPYGYAYDKGLGKLIIDSEKALTVRLIYRLYTEGIDGQRLGMPSIVEELSLGRTLSSPSGGRSWNTKTVQKILSDTVYIGRHKLGVAVSEPIINEDTFESVQKLRSSNRHFHSPTKRLWPLQGRIRCANCGSNLQTSGGATYRYYRCPGRSRTGKYHLETGKKCGTHAIRADRVEAGLWEALVRTITDPQELVTVLESGIAALKAREKDLSQDVGPIQENLQEIEAEMKRLDWAYVWGNISGEELDTYEKKLRGQRESLQSRLDAYDPGRLDELEMTRARLRVAGRYLEGVRKSASVDPNDFSTPMPTVRTLINKGESQRYVTLEPVPEDPDDRRADFVSTWLLLPGWEEQAPPETDPVARTAWCLTQAMNRLQGEVFVFDDRLELKGGLEFDIPSVAVQDESTEASEVLYQPLGDASTSVH